MALISAKALCRQCGFAQYKNNAMGLAAQHHYRTGHTVDVDLYNYHVFGDRDEQAFHESGSPVVSASQSSVESDRDAQG